MEPARRPAPYIDGAEVLTPMALAIAQQPPDVRHRVCVVSWNNEATTALTALRDLLHKRDRSIPVRSVRALLELDDPLSLRLDSKLGTGGSSRVVLWTQQTLAKATEIAGRVLHAWLVNDVTPLVSGDTERALLEQLLAFARDNALVIATERTVNPYRWTITPSKTAKGTTPHSYDDLVDFLARALEGAVVFPDASPLRRIAGVLGSGQAELMTDPIHVGRNNSFSLVLRLHLLTFPGRPTPIVNVQCTRRVWVHQLKDRTATGSMRAYALPPNSTRAFVFHLVAQSGAPTTDASGATPAGNGKKARRKQTSAYVLSDDFAPIERRFFTGVGLTAQHVLTSGASRKECQLVVGRRHGVAMKADVKHGVPDIDRIDAFDRLRDQFASLGLTPWSGIEEVVKERAATDAEQYWEQYDEPDNEQFAAWRQEAEAAIRSCYNGAHHLVIGVQPMQAVEQDGCVAEQILTAVLGESVRVTRIPLPVDVHGPRAALPAAGDKNPERAEVRMTAWQPFIEAVHRLERDSKHPIDGVLVLAHRWYDENEHDDGVNKRAARIALARALGKPVQYLQPREDEAPDGKRGKPKTHEQITKDFQRRLMMAWLDLAYKSIGRVKPAKLIARAEQLYETDRLGLFTAYPDHILALGVLRRNTTTYLRNERSFVPFAIELHIESGVCRASVAYEESPSKQLVWTPMQALPDALVALARLGPLQLYSNTKDSNYRNELADRTQHFFKEQIAQLARTSLNPLVIVDANSARSVWPWLTDAAIDANNIQIAGGYNQQAVWPMVRMVRVRTGNSPKILLDRTRKFDDPVSGRTLAMRAPKWLQGSLLRLTDTRNSHVFLSFGNDIRHRKLSQSCYRTLDGFEQKRVDEKRRYVAGTVAPLTDAWATPNGVEIVVLRHGQDDPTSIAQLTAWLRQCYAHFGLWTSKPAPLFFDSVLKEYLADVDIEEETDAVLEEAEPEG